MLRIALQLCPAVCFEAHFYVKVMSGSLLAIMEARHLPLMLPATALLLCPLPSFDVASGSVCSCGFLASRDFSATCYLVLVWLSWTYSMKLIRSRSRAELNVAPLVAILLLSDKGCPSPSPSPKLNLTLPRVHVIKKVATTR